MIGPSLWLFGATGVGNLCNALYHVYMARHLSPQHYAMLSALTGLMTILAVPATTIQTTTSHQVALLSARAEWQSLRLDIRRRLLVAGFVTVGGWLVIAGFHRALMAFLRSPEAPGVVMSWGAAVALAFLLPIAWGALQGLQRFAALGVNLALSAGLRLLGGILFVGLGQAVLGAMQGLLVATIVTLGISLIHVRRILLEYHPQRIARVWWERIITWVSDGVGECLVILKGGRGISRYALVVALSVMAYTSLTNADVVLVKHFFEPMTAGHYAVGAMVSRIVLFLPMALSMVLFPKVARAAAEGGDARPLLRRVFLGTALVSGMACAACLRFPTQLMRILAGAVYPETVPIIRLLAVAMAGMALSNVGLVYLLALQRVRLTIPYWVGALGQIGLITAYHSTLQQAAGVTVAMAIALAGFSAWLAVTRRGVQPAVALGLS